MYFVSHIMNPVRREGMTLMAFSPGIDDFGHSTPELDSLIYTDADGRLYFCHTCRVDEGFVWPREYGPKERYSEPQFWYSIASTCPTDWDDWYYDINVSSSGIVSFYGTAQGQYGGGRHEGLCLHGPCPPGYDDYTIIPYSLMYHCTDATPHHYPR